MAHSLFENERKSTPGRSVHNTTDIPKKLSRAATLRNKSRKKLQTDDNGVRGKTKRKSLNCARLDLPHY